MYLNWVEHVVVRVPPLDFREIIECSVELVTHSLLLSSKFELHQGVPIDALYFVYRKPGYVIQGLVRQCLLSYEGFFLNDRAVPNYRQLSSFLASIGSSEVTDKSLRRGDHALDPLRLTWVEGGALPPASDLGFYFREERASSLSKCIGTLPKLALRGCDARILNSPD